MPTPITMPALSPTMTHGTLTKWVKSEGDTIEPGDVIAEIETDKATMEVESVDDGVLAKILINEGAENVAVGEVIAIMAEEGEDISGYEVPSGDAAPEKTQEDAPKQEAKSEKAPANKSNDRIKASPLAKRIAKDKGIDLSTITASGANGRIVKADVEGMTQNDTPYDTPVTHQSASPTKVPHSGMRKVIAQRLTESKQTIPHFYLNVDCTLDSLLSARKTINDKANGAYKLSVNDFIVKACAAALMAVPETNVEWGDDALTQFYSADVCVAVSTDGGLITPIVKSAHAKSLSAISGEVKSLAKRAREGKLQPSEYQGGTFTLSNLGMFGVKNFNAIINPPQSMILAVGAGEQKAVAENGSLAIRTVMSATLSVDHRAVDGAVAAQWLAAFKRFIENPVEMLV